MTTKTWSAGEFVNPGELRQPRSTPPVVQSALNDPSFEAGTGWTFGAGISVVVDGRAYEGTHVAKHAAATFGTIVFTNDNVVPVVPGQSIRATGFYLRETNVTGRQSMRLLMNFFDSGMSLISTAQGTLRDSGATNTWYFADDTFVAPPGAAFARLGVSSFNQNAGGSHAQLFDAFSWDYVQPVAQSGLVYKAVQANAGFTGATEPTWPLTVGLTVVDNEVTWEAVLASSVTWEAHAILKSGPTEPAWPVVVGAEVLDNTISWRAVSRRIEDVKCPNSKYVAIAAGHIFAGDDDIIAFSAANNPLDWTTEGDAGFLPFGLQTYGDNPVRALGLYRSNLAAFNSAGFQLWQVDPDPVNMAFLDAVPLGSTYHQALAPLANDLIVLGDVGVRNVAVAGASTNLQADGVGEPIDSLVREKLKALGDPADAVGLFWPAQGQYWLIPGSSEVYVLTINGAKKKSWSRYTFPERITDWTLLGNQLYLRSINGHIWRMDEDTLVDDAGGADAEFQTVIWWPFLDLGSIGIEKMMVGFDVVTTAPEGVTISVGYNQKDRTQRTTDYEIDQDSLTGKITPFPVSAPSFDIRLTFAAQQKVEWDATIIYVNDMAIGS